MLGLGHNNWKLAIGNFFIIFGAQTLFALSDLMQTPDVWPSTWFFCKTVLSSAVATALFYGYNKKTNKVP